MIHLQNMFLNVIRQQIPQQVPLAQGHHIGHRQAGPDDLVQQLAAYLGHYGPLIAAEGGRQIGLHHLLEGRGVRRAAELLPFPCCLQIVDIADQITQQTEPAVAEVGQEIVVVGSLRQPLPQKFFSLFFCHQVPLLFHDGSSQSGDTLRGELLEKVLQMFPILKERLNFPAGSLSGGQQQQMLAIARAMMMAPKLLILDEPSLGLAPVVVDDVYRTLDIMKREGSSMLVIEQNLTKALSISDRGYVLETGHMQMTGPSRELLNNKDIQRAYLGI